MGLYKDNVEYTPHNFANTTVTLKDLTDDSTHNVEALHTIEAARKESRWETQEVNSGPSIPVEKPQTAGSVKFTILEASATTDWLNDHIDNRIQIVVSDAGAPNLNCSCKGYLMVHPAVKRDQQADLPEWEIVSPYLKMVGGSYRLIEEA